MAKKEEKEIQIKEITYENKKIDASGSTIESKYIQVKSYDINKAKKIFDEIKNV